MGAVAGKVMIRPRGDYDSSAVYDKLDLVRYDNRPWLCCRNNLIGIAPKHNDQENWMNIIDVSIANADTLDGHDSDYFAKAGAVEVTLLASDWSPSAPYTQTVPVSGIKAEDIPIPMFVDDGTDESSSKAKQKAYGYISYFDSSDNFLTVTCKYKKPTTNLTIVLKGV